jgi:hypothetical protein
VSISRSSCPVLACDLQPAHKESTKHARTGSVGQRLGSITGTIYRGRAAVAVDSGRAVVTTIVACYLVYDWNRMIAAIDNWVPPARGDTVRARLIAPTYRRSIHSPRLPPRAGSSLTGLTCQTCNAVPPSMSSDIEGSKSGRAAGPTPDQIRTGGQPAHSITSSATASSLSGTVRPSAFAVLRLIDRTYFTGVCTGRSDGFSPLRIRST